MKRIAYFLATAILAVTAMSSCQRKAISQDEIEEFNQQNNKSLIELNNNVNTDSTTTLILIDSTQADTTIKINAQRESPQSEITISQFPNFNRENIGAVFIIFTAISAPFICIVLIVFFIIRGNTLRQRDRNKLIGKAIDNKYPIPDNLFEAPKAPQSRLHSALVWIACGIGFTIFFFVVAPDKSAFAIGLIPSLVGIAKLITYFIEDRKE